MTIILEKIIFPVARSSGEALTGELAKKRSFSVEPRNRESLGGTSRGEGHLIYVASDPASTTTFYRMVEIQIR